MIKEVRKLHGPKHLSSFVLILQCQRFWSLIMSILQVLALGLGILMHTITNAELLSLRVGSELYLYRLRVQVLTRRLEERCSHLLPLATPFSGRLMNQAEEVEYVADLFHILLAYQITLALMQPYICNTN